MDRVEVLAILKGQVIEDVHVGDDGTLWAIKVPSGVYMFQSDWDHNISLDPDDRKPCAWFDDGTLERDRRKRETLESG